MRSRLSIAIRALWSPSARVGWGFIGASILQFVGALEIILSISDRLTEDGQVNLTAWLAQPTTALYIGTAILALTILSSLRQPSRRRIVGLYPNQRHMTDHGRGLPHDLTRAEELWVAFESGAFFRDNLTPQERESGKIVRMVVLHPQSPMVDYLSSISEKTPNEIRRYIERTTREAKRLNIDIRWSRVPLLNCVIGFDRAFLRNTISPRWARVQVFSPQLRSSEWPTIDCHKWSGDGESVDAFRNIYEAMWEGAEEPPADAFTQTD